MMETLETDPRLALAQDIARFYDNPLGFVLYVFPWGKPGFLEHHDGPDLWQLDFLRRLGEEVRARKFDGHIPVAPGVRILGEAPKASFSQFIPHDIVSACRKFKAQSYEHMPLIYGVDVARQGDDRSAIVCRQGRKVRLLAVYRGLDTVEVAHRVAEFIETEKPSAVVVDATGMGVGTYDELKHCGYGRYLHEFWAGGKAADPNAHANKRAEAWSLMRDAPKAGLEIPDSPDWETDLCGTEYGFDQKGALLLEPKDAMKSRFQ
jgi:hypothetical protein